MAKYALLKLKYAIKQCIGIGRFIIWYPVLLNHIREARGGRRGLKTKIDTVPK